MRSDKDKALTEIRRERYERWLSGPHEQKPVEQRIADVVQSGEEMIHEDWCRKDASLFSGCIQRYAD